MEVGDLVFLYCFQHAFHLILSHDISNNAAKWRHNEKVAETKSVAQWDRAESTRILIVGYLDSFREASGSIRRRAPIKTLIPRFWV